MSSSPTALSTLDSIAKRVQSYRPKGVDGISTLQEKLQSNWSNI